jgi:hypothetical protein
MFLQYLEDEYRRSDAEWSVLLGNRAS